MELDSLRLNSSSPSSGAVVSSEDRHEATASFSHLESVESDFAPDSVLAGLFLAVAIFTNDLDGSEPFLGEEG